MWTKHSVDHHDQTGYRQSFPLSFSVKKMSQGMPNNSDLVKFRVVNEEEYRANVKRAEEAQAQLDHFKAMNEAAKKAHDQQQELLRKIQEGKEAEYASYKLLWT